MKQKSVSKQSASERLVKDIKRKTRKIYSAEEKIRIVLDGLRGEMSISELCRREGIVESVAPGNVAPGNVVSEVALRRIINGRRIFSKLARNA